MTTAEATISLVNRLSEDEMLNVQNYIKRIFISRKRTNMKMYSAKEIDRILDKSVHQAKRGKLTSHHTIMEEVHKQYGI